MHSKNKPTQTANQKRYVSLLAEQPCVVCGAFPVEIHEFSQGLWHASVPLCPSCHRGQHGWHGDRLAWTLAKMDPFKAIDITVERVFKELLR